MSTLLFGHDEAVAGWVGRMVGKPFTPPFTALGIVDAGGALRGGFVFNNFHEGASIEMSLAGSQCFSRGVWRGILAYVFEQCGVKRLQIHTRASNKTVRRVAPKGGFRFEGTARRMYGDENGLTYSLTVDDLPAFRKKWRL